MRSNLIVLTILAAGISLFACNGNKNTSDSESSEQAQGKIKDEKLAAAYTDYLELKNALVATDAVKAKSAAGNLQNSLKNVGGSEHAQQQASGISSSDDIKVQREHFSGLSNAFIELIKKGEKGDAKIYIQHCPMALNNKGADWISDKKEIRNPYFGDEMLECGEVKEELK